VTVKLKNQFIWNDPSVLFRIKIYLMHTNTWICELCSQWLQCSLYDWK